MDKTRTLNNFSWTSKLRRSSTKHSKAGRRKEIAFPPPLPIIDTADYSSATETEPFPTLYSSGDYSLAMQDFVQNEDMYEPVSGLWQELDRSLSCGGDGSSTRGIDRNMADGITDADGWRETLKEFSNASHGAMHPVVAAFTMAQQSNSTVVLGVEHIWLMILQSLSAVVKTGQGEFAVAGDDMLWSELRRSSGVPSRIHDENGRECRLFASHADGYHPLYATTGAAPVVMAAAVAGHVNTGRVEYGRIEQNGAVKPVVMQRPRGLRMATHKSIRGLQLVGTIQSWSALCMMTRQLKYSYANQGFDWWLYRAHATCQHLTDYFAAQFESPASLLPSHWRQFATQALQKTQSSQHFDGWLATLFSVDNEGKQVHSESHQSMTWGKVPAGVDMQRVAATSDSWQNLYSGFVGHQRLVRARIANRSATLHGDEEFPAIVVRDCASTLTESDDLAFDIAESGIECAVAPILGWALDRQL